MNSVARPTTTSGGLEAGTCNPRRLRVLFLIDSISDDGGAERIAVGLATNLPPDRFDVWFCSTRRFDAAAAARLDRAGVRHLHLGRRSKWDLHRLGALVALVRRQRFDVIHAHLFGSNLWGTLIGRACRVPVVLAHEHTWSYEGNPVRKWLDGRVIGRLSTRFIAVSSLDAERMVSIEHVRPEKVVMLPNFYVPPPQPTRTDLRRELSVDASTPLVVAAAVLRPQKALDVLLHAHALVTDALPDAQLAIAGDGQCRASLEATAADLGLGRNVRFLGRRQDVDSIFQTADVVAMSSDYEGTPVVALECMANRVPLVATSVGGLPDVVENGVTGTLVAPRDPRALADAILELLRDPPLRERMGVAAEARLPEFTIDAAIRRLTGLYDSLAAEDHRPVDMDRPLTARDPLVLCYHAVSPSWDCGLSVDPDVFERQMRYLLDHGWRAVTFSEAVLGQEQGQILAVTFDDAFFSTMEYAAPILERLGMPATIFAPSSFMGGGAVLSWPGIEHWSATDSAHELAAMDWPALRLLADRGWEIGSHTLTHPRLTKLDDETLRLELSRSREECSQHLGRPCRSVAYPYGDVDQGVIDAARAAGYVAGARLSRDLAPAGPHSYPRVGIYHGDSWARFRLKVARPVRDLRANDAWRRTRS